MLKRNVQVRHELAALRVQLEQRCVELLWIKIKQAQPTQTRHFEQLLHQLDERAALIEITSVRDRVLTHQVDLDHTLIDQALCFFDDVARRARALRAAKARDRTEAALARTTFCDLEISAVTRT
jgi:hypothetical protein